MSRLFQVYAEDLSKLETALPRLMELTLPACNNAEVQMLWTEVREIISNVRWDYGPPSEVVVIPAGDE